MIHSSSSSSMSAPLIQHMARVEQVFAIDARVYIGRLSLNGVDVCTALAEWLPRTQRWSIYSDHAFGISFVSNGDDEQRTTLHPKQVVLRESEPILLCTTAYGVWHFRFDALFGENLLEEASDKDFLVLAVHIRNEFSDESKLDMLMIRGNKGVRLRSVFDEMVLGCPESQYHTMTDLDRVLQGDDGRSSDDDNDDDIDEGDFANGDKHYKQDILRLDTVWQSQLKCGNTIPLESQCPYRDLTVVDAPYMTEQLLFRRGYLFRDYHLRCVLSVVHVVPKEQEAALVKSNGMHDKAHNRRIIDSGWLLTPSKRACLICLEPFTMEVGVGVANTTTSTGVASSTLDVAIAIGYNNDHNEHVNGGTASQHETKEEKNEDDELNALSPIVTLSNVTSCVTHQCCTSCMRAYVEQQISDRRVQDIPCPGERCPHTLRDDEVRMQLTGEHLRKYERFLQLASDSDARACPRCFHVQTVNQFIDTSVTCDACHTRYCSEHELAHGADESCHAYRQRIQASLAADMAYMRSTSVACPGWRCRARITKTSGCNHMVCPQCRTEFCYLCGGYYFGGAHFTKRLLFGCYKLNSMNAPPNSRYSRFRSALRILVSPWAIPLWWMLRAVRIAVLALLWCVCFVVWIAMSAVIVGVWLAWLVGFSPLLVMLYFASRNDWSKQMALADVCRWGIVMVTLWCAFGPWRLFLT